MTFYDATLAPFAEFGFMRRGLVGCLALALGCGPIGTILVIRRMSLMGDALSHAVLPGAALGFIFAGLWLPAMTLGGVAVGLAVALLSGLVTRLTPLREDASFAAFYLISLALGVLMAVGLMMLPAAAARFWVRELWSLSAASSGLALASAFLGLLLSYHL